MRCSNIIIRTCSNVEYFLSVYLKDKQNTMLLPLSLIVIIGLPTRSIGPYVKKGKPARKGQQRKDGDVKTAMKGRKGQDGEEKEEKTARK